MVYTATVSSKYQVVIPRAIRERFALKPGQKVVFIPYEHTLRLVIAPPIAGRGSGAGCGRVDGGGPGG